MGEYLPALCNMGSWNGFTPKWFQVIMVQAIKKKGAKIYPCFNSILEFR